MSRFYRVIWRWHFYAGIFVIPFMLMLAVTGGIYLFKPPLDAAFYPQHVVPEGQMRSLTEQTAAVQSTFGSATISKVVPPPAPDRSTEVGLTTIDAQSLTVFVNPYTAQVLGQRNDESNLQYPAVTLHGELLLGKPAVAIMAILGIIFPFAGISLVAVLLLDFLIIRRIPALEKVLG